MVLQPAKRLLLAPQFLALLRKLLPYQRNDQSNHDHRQPGQGDRGALKRPEHLLTIIGLFWNDYRKLNRNYIFLGSVLALFIPVINGLITGDWIWKTLSNEQYYVFSVDVTWCIIGVFGLLICQFNLNSKKDNEPVLKDSENKLTAKPEFQEERTPVLQSFSKDS